MTMEIVTNKERKPDDIHIKSEFGDTAKSIEELTKRLDLPWLAKVAIVGYTALLFVVFTFIVIVRASFSFF